MTGKTPDKFFTVWQPYYTSPARCCQFLTVQKNEEKGEKMTGTEIKMKLVEQTLSTAWLRRRLEDAGEPVPHTVLCNILRGSRTGPQPDRVLAKSEQILNDYISKIGGDTQ